MKIQRKPALTVKRECYVKGHRLIRVVPPVFGPLRMETRRFYFEIEIKDKAAVRWLKNDKRRRKKNG